MKAGEEEKPEEPKKGKKDYDDRFYDLDDGFIDDDDMEEDYGANGLNGMGGGTFDQMMQDDFYNEEADLSTI